MSEQQPLIAAMLSAVVPGLGHAYLGAWGKSLIWFATVLMAVTLIGFEAGIEPGAAASLGDLLQTIVTAVSPVGLVAVVLLVSANVIDAFRVGQRLQTPDSTVGRQSGDEQTCPNCNRSVDADLNFCHWCTTEFDGDE